MIMDTQKPICEPVVYSVNEPEVLHGAAAETMSSDEDFNKALATALTPDEFLQHMYKRIEAWPWKEK
jgi:hypothetical protein